jgi:AcrR family transcriptional regulator
MDRAVGLRERKKRATRAALADAALRLCVEHGFDGVTVEQVATDAGVSLRTFFNYFSSKEEAVVAGDVATAAAFVAAFERRPADEPVLDALRSALVEISDHVDRERAAQLRALRGTPSLLPHQIAAYSAQERALATAVGHRVGETTDDTYPPMVAAAVMAVIRVIIGLWLDDRRDFAELIEVMVARLAKGFGAP